MKKIKATHIEIIYVVHQADSSFLKMNPVLKRYHFELQTLPINEFERLYGEAFNLGPIKDRCQNMPITIPQYKNDDERTFYISKEFYQKMMYHYGVSCNFFETGYVVFLKAAKTSFVESASDFLTVLLFAEDLNKKIIKLEYYLRLIRYGFFEFDTSFAHIVQTAKIIPLKLNPSFTPATINKIPYQEKDNNLLSALLRAESGIAEYINIALQSFDQTLHIENIKIRFVQLMQCLEMCLNNFIYESTSQIIAQHTSILLSRDKEQRNTIYNEVIEFYEIKKNILIGNSASYNNNISFQNILKTKVETLENMSRDILKKLIRLNIKEKEQFMYELSLKASQIHQKM
ncbi:hypothetical protein ACFOW1_00780 [Parasediminibacterium paludis]|uniref:Uncharacterized protein n=1 Tax=Parasediminibacterium paludis TaxID=908966 RepID=A0ABV8PT36_9BACT